MQAYTLVQPHHEASEPDFRHTKVCFHSDYLPGGAHELEYRLFWHPNQSDATEDREVFYAVRASRSARFEDRAAS
jgi:hypothetical protein